MKNYATTTILKTLTFVLLIICSTAGNTTAQPRWEKLGTRIVNKDLDRDEIPVTVLRGTYKAIKLRVNRSPVSLHRFVVHFTNGGTQEVMVRKNLRKGEETRVIDLKGGQRGVKKIVFWYDTKDLAIGRAIIEVYGRQ